MAELLPLVNAINEHGTFVTELVCDHCGHTFTVCPPVDPREWGRSCLGDSCPSYDLSRDVDIFFDALSEAGQVDRQEADRG